MPFSTEEVRLGGWLVAEYKAISYYDVDDPVFEDYEATIIAGRTADFLSSIRSLGKIDGQKYEVYRKLARLRRKQIEVVLQHLQDIEAVEFESLPHGLTAIRSITSKVTTRAGVLGAVGRVFQRFDPSEKAQASIAILEATVHVPIPQLNLVTDVAKKGFANAAVSGTVDDLVSFDLLSRTTEQESGQPLLYNPHVFKSDAQTAYAALKGLGAADRARAQELLEHVRKNPGVPFPSASDKRIISLLTKVGMIDISGVQLKSGTTAREFPTAPELWGVFSAKAGLSKDMVDDSKLLLNSLRYGELYSPIGRGRIDRPVVLVNALIERGQVGPATAIGEDYPLPLARGIVAITESRLRPGRFFMELRKKDVAESVRDVLEQNAILPAGDVTAPEILREGGSLFSPPDHIRMRRTLPKELIESRDSLAFELRTYRKRS